MEDKLQEILSCTKFFDGQTLAERLKFYNIPGLSFCVVKDFKIACSYAVGEKIHGESESITEKTLFQQASISKHISAIATLKLWQEGVIDIDRDVHAYIKDFKITDAQGKIVKVTPRQLLSHTAGLNVHGFGGYEPGQSLPTTLEILQGKEPANSEKVMAVMSPGVKYSYSGGGTTILQKMLCDILQRDFAQIMEEYVLKPMGMADSTFCQPLPGDIHIAYGHYFSEGKLTPVCHVYPEQAAAGLWSTPTDLAHFGIHLQNILQNKGDGVLDLETAEQMTRPQIDEFFQAEGLPFVQIGLGSFIKGEGENLRFGHSGSNEGYLSLMNFFKYKAFGSVININSESGKFLRELEDTIYHVFGL